MRMCVQVATPLLSVVFSRSDLNNKSVKLIITFVLLLLFYLLLNKLITFGVGASESRFLVLTKRITASGDENAMDMDS